MSGANFMFDTVEVGSTDGTSPVVWEEWTAEGRTWVQVKFDRAEETMRVTLDDPRRDDIAMLHQRPRFDLVVTRARLLNVSHLRMVFEGISKSGSSHFKTVTICLSRRYRDNERPSLET